MFISLRLVDNVESACFEFSTRSLRRKHRGNHVTGHAHLSRPNLLGPRHDFRCNFVSFVLKDLSKQERGSVDYRVDKNSGIVVVKWLGNSMSILFQIVLA